MATVYQDWLGEGGLTRLSQRAANRSVQGSGTGPLLPGHVLAESGYPGTHVKIESYGLQTLDILDLSA